MKNIERRKTAKLHANRCMFEEILWSEMAFKTEATGSEYTLINPLSGIVVDKQ